MTRTRQVRHIVCLCTLIGSTWAHADVAIGDQLIISGTEIKVLAPGPDLDLQEIIDDISDADVDNPYLIRLGAGEYIIAPDDTTQFGLVMAPYISIVGSGREATILKGDFSTAATDSTSAIVTGASNALLADLSVVHADGSNVAIAIFNNAASPRIERVSATVTDGSGRYGVYNLDSSPTMVEVSATVSGNSGSNFGVYNVNSSPRMTEVIASASGGFNFTNTSYAVYNITSSPAMTEVVATASSGGTNYGVFNVISSPTIADSTITASGGTTTNIGLYNDDTISSPQIRRSLLSGATNALQFSGAAGTRISNTQLSGGIDADPDTGSKQCRNAFDETLSTVAC